MQTPETSLIFAEKPEIPFPAFLRSLGFDDHSYRNDLCARAHLYLSEDEKELWPGLVIWVDHVDPNDREFNDYPRFYCFSVSNEDEYNDNTSPHVIYSGESENECEVEIRSYLRRMGVAQ